MTLFVLVLLLTLPYLLLSLVGRWVPHLQIPRAKRARVGLSLFFVLTSLAHFISTEEMAQMLPRLVPYRKELVYVTGVLEVLGAIGVWILRFRKLTGVLLILMLVGLMPANVYSAINRVEFGGHAAGPLYLLVRVPFQLFVIWWTYFATEQDWFKRQ